MFLTKLASEMSCGFGRNFFFALMDNEPNESSATLSKFELSCLNVETKIYFVWKLD